MLLLLAAVYAVQKEFRNLEPAEIGRAIRAIPTRPLALAFLCTVLTYGVLTLYDRLGTLYAGHRLGYRRVAFASFCAFALSHNLGFAAVSGAAVRYRLYSHWGLTPLETGKTIAFCSLTFGLGGMVLGGTILLLMPTALPYVGEHVPAWALYGLGALLWLVVLLYLALAGSLGTFRLRGHSVALPELPMALLQVGLAAADVAATASILWLLLPPAPRLGWLVFLGVYLASYSAGLLANLPGGLGVFDTALLFGLSPFLPASPIIAAIAVFRLYFYVIPLFLAGALFAGSEVLMRRDGRAPARGPRWSEPDFAAAAASGAVAVSGVLLLGLGLFAPRAAPPHTDPFAEIARQAGQFVPSLIGAGLVVMALGLIRRVNLAWTGALVLLVGGSGFILGEGERIWPIGVLTLAALVLAPFRAYFYRHARLLTGRLDRTSALSLLALAACGLALAGFGRRVHGLPNDAFWAVVLSPAAPWALRASLALVVALALTAVWLLLRPGRVGWRPWNVEARLRLLMMGARPPAQADGILYGEAQRAAVPFRRLDGLLVALGDPAGPEADRISAVWRLCDLARQEGRDPAVYRAGRRLLKVYNDLGLTALPLGPDGMPVREGSPDSRASQHYLVCVAERDYAALCPLLPRLEAESGLTHQPGGETAPSS
ncbi:MAG: lysylphosphatidylglycerol synthetase family protein [Acetobacteraceae bacterium]|nr:lysylphosphatidylglycerol synthetase family protein [Acetobacteraceae bacterium]